MKKALLLFLLFPLFGFSQSRPNSDIIQIVIKDRLVNFSGNEELPNPVLILNGLTDSNRELAVDAMCLSLPEIDYLGWNMKNPSLLKEEEVVTLFIGLCKSLNQNEFLEVNGLDSLKRVVFVPKKKIEKLFKTNRVKKIERAWKTFYKNYPESLGFMEFSKIVYSENRAIVYISHRFNPLGAIGYVAILKKTENGYVVEETIDLWMS